MLLQKQKLSIRPLTTAHLAQTMTLLQLPADELRQKIEAALASNPALDLAEEPRCPNCHRLLPVTGPCPTCSSPQGCAPDQPIVFISPRSDFSSSYHTQDNYDDENTPKEEWTPAFEDLPTFIMRQIATELDPSDRPLAAHILTSLDEDGLLRTPLVEFARYHHVTLTQVEKVVSLIQHAEPLGVGSPTPQAALLVQLEALAETQPVPPLAARAIKEGMDLLSRKAYSELGRLLHIPAREVQKIADFIVDYLYPYPARTNWGDIRHPTAPTQAYHEADILISQLNNDADAQMVVEIVSPYAGSLRIDPFFRQALSEAPAEKSAQWHTDLEKANLLVKCLQQRNQTLVRLMQRLVCLQRSFIMKGDAYLLPVTRAQIADELQLHESTISRAVAGKAVQLPNNRIVPLSKLFDRSLNVRMALHQIVDNEEKPLSDSQIAKLLVRQGYDVARRTVAKYRSIEGILPARLRHKNGDKPHH